MLHQRLLYSNLFDFSNRDAVCNQVFISPRNLAGREGFHSPFVYPSMKTLTRTLFIILLLAFFSQSGVAAVLEKVTNQSLEDGRVLVNLFFNEHSNPKFFSLPGDSPRLVLDFPDARYLGQQKIAVDGAILQAIRIFTHQNPLKTRVVFDLHSGAVDYKQEFLEDGRTLRISLSGKGQPPPVKTAVVAPGAPAKAATAASPPVKTEAAAASPVKAATVAAPPVKTEAVVSPPVEAATTVSPPVKTEAVAAPPVKAEAVASPPVKTEAAISPPAKTVTVAPPPAEPKAALPPAPKETISPPKTESPAKPPTEVPPAATGKTEQGLSGAGKSAASSPFDSPFLATEAPAKPGEKTAPPAAPNATRLLGYALVSQPAENDVLRLQLDGYANPEITAHEGNEPQLVCFFPKMRLAVKKGINRPLSGKFVRKMKVEEQKKPLGVRMVIDLQSGYDYYVQKIFNTDESAFFLVINVSNP